MLSGILSPASHLVTVEHATPNFRANSALVRGGSYWWRYDVSGCCIAALLPPRHRMSSKNFPHWRLTSICQRGKVVHRTKEMQR